MLKLPIYLDHQATTPIDPLVLEAMMPYLTEQFGNASSMDHTYGANASVAIENARAEIAMAISSRPEDIVFTSGATEANNMAIIGTMTNYARRGDHIITCSTEHMAVLNTVKYLETIGKKVTVLPVDERGNIRLEHVENAITKKTVMITIMAVNNEIGTIHNIDKIGEIAHKHDVIFHTDAAQAVGHVDLNVKKMNIDLMSLSAHKMYGPKGIGALYIRGIRPKIRTAPIMFGGGQERGRRSGTYNVPSIVGFAKAIKIAIKKMSYDDEKYEKWNGLLLTKLQKYGKVNGTLKNRIKNNVNMRFAGVEGKAIINSVSDELAISAGSACTTQTTEPSHVLLAIGLNKTQAHSSIRIGFGRFNTDSEIVFAADKIISTLESLTKVRG